MPESARLIIHGAGEVEVDQVIAFLTDLRNAYNSIIAFEAVMDALRRAERYYPFPFPAPLPLSFGLNAYIVRRSRRAGLQLVGEWPPTPESITELVPLNERLVLDAVNIASPGAWEVLGSLNPLETLRKYLNDRHERRKDRDYREKAEEKRLRLENARLQMGAIADGVKLAREVGATDRDFAPLLNALINNPLLALDKHQDQGLIGSAEVRNVGEK
jgi:hypothetical protein